MSDSWTLPDLVTEVAARLARLPEPKNGQVRAVPDERTIRYYGTIGLLARPIAMRGRTALYGDRHLAQVVAIKRMQSAGRSLAEITALWPTLDDTSLQRMSGVELPAAKREFWKQRPEARIDPTASPFGDAADAGRARVIDPTASPFGDAADAGRARVIDPTASPFGDAADAGRARVIDLAPGVHLALDLPEGVALDPAVIRAIRAAAAPLVTELVQLAITSNQEEGT